VINSFFIMCLL